VLGDRLRAAALRLRRKIDLPVPRYHHARLSAGGQHDLAVIALDMLRAQRSRVQETSEETTAGAAKEDIAVSPLAIPMLAGPGAISTVIVLHGQTQGLAQQIALCGCILVVSLVSYLVLRLSARGMQWLSPIALRITTRVMGLLLAAIAFQFMLNAIAALRGTRF